MGGVVGAQSMAIWGLGSAFCVFGGVFSLNTEWLQFLPAPLENQFLFHFCINILFPMGKKMKKTTAKPQQLVVQHPPCSPSPLPGHPLRMADPNANFAQYSRGAYQFAGKDKGEGKEREGQLEGGAGSLFDFFNNKRYYSKIELDCHVICLANIININKQRHTIPFTADFKHKIRAYLQNLTQEHHSPAQYNNSLRPIFYILVALIYQNKQQPFKNTLLDRSITAAILKLSIPASAKISKLYGIIMLSITSRSQSKSAKEAIIRNILMNLKSVQHQPSLFNLLVYLRAQKNKVRVNLKDVEEGGVFPFLMEGYQKYIEQYQSYYILDYLHHLLGLFPSVAHTITTAFIAFLINNLRLGNMHHPMHETTILAFIQKGLKYVQAEARERMIGDIGSIEVQDMYLQTKIAKIIVEHQKCEGLIASITQQDYLMNFIRCIRQHVERNTVVNCVEVLLAAINKIKQYNMSLSRYLFWLLKHQVRTVGVVEDEVNSLIANAGINLE